MRYGVFVFMLFLGMLFYLGTSTVSSDDAADLTPLRPSSLLPVLGRGVQAVAARVWDIGQVLADAVGRPQRERVKRHLPIEAVHQ